MTLDNFIPEKFTDGEIYVIEKIWKDLTEKSDSDNKGIYKHIFQTYTNIDGLLGDRIFDIFASGSLNYVDKDNFIKGLEVICFGDDLSQGKFLFDIFDIKREKKVEKKYMSIIINSIPHKYICKCIHKHALEITESNVETESDSNLNLNYENWTNNCVYVEAFKNFDTNNHDYLEFDEFIKWTTSNHILINYIKESINYHIQSESKRKQSISKTDILPKNLECDNRFESEMHKIGKRFGMKISRYYLLYGNCLYYYKSKSCLKPIGVIFLAGSMVSPISSTQLEISELDMCTGKYHLHQKRLLDCASGTLRDEWVNKLIKASHVISFDSVYKINDKIGSGAFSTVYKCTRIYDSKEFAVKIISKENLNSKDKINLKNEISILKLVSHPNIIHMDGFYETQSHLYFVIELIKGGDLFENIVNRPRFNDIELKKLAKTLGECLAYLHSLGIAHRDIKPENILCDNITGRLILTDFGLSQIILPDSQLSDTCGTLDYVAPEILLKYGYGYSTDIWSLGIILYLVYYGNLPFTGKDDLDTINNILMVEPIYSENKNYLANDLISKLLDKNTLNRITAKEILLHPFLKS